MNLRLHTFLAGFLALIAAACLLLAPAQAKPASGGYQLFEQVALADQHAIQLAALGNFDYHAKIAPECCNATKAGTRPDFYVSPNGEAVEGTLYRYSDSAYADDILQNGGSPGIEGRGHYLGTEALDSASSVSDRYQIAPEWSNPTVRGELDSIQLYDPDAGTWRLQTPTSNGNTTTIPEPYTSAYPEYGTGGARQYITDPNTPLRYDNVDIIGD